MQTTSHILMIRPVNFTYNEQTAINNAFQVAGHAQDVQQRALAEFDAFVRKLRDGQVDVLVVDDTAEPHTPDSLFPNNWISFHDDGTVLLYPMYAANRRLERKPGVLEKIRSRFRVRHLIDLSSFEQQNRYLEGTGSLVLDREKKIAYACLSPRTDKELVEQFGRDMHYHPVVFGAVDGNGRAIYHTNVMMCVADRYVVVCLDAIPDAGEREHVENTIHNSGKELIAISLEQMNQFAGNMLQVSNAPGERLLIMSTRAYRSLKPDQVERLSAYNEIVHASLEAIETNGGGSARCMMAEVHLPVLQK